MSVPIRVLVVDDSVFIRHTVAKYLEADPELTVVGTARDGVTALEQIAALRPDVITLDVEMPRMDGLTALRHIMAERPTPVVMLSSLTQRGARITIRALMWGAIDFVPKPSANTEVRTVMDELITKVKLAAGTPSGRLAPTPAAETITPDGVASAPSLFRSGDSVVIIGASTGGPRALQQVLSGFPADLPAAMVVVQHMPAGFTHSLAQRLNKHTALMVQEAADGDRLARGLVLVTPGDFHLNFQGANRVVLTKGPPRNHVRPSIDVTMESGVEQHGTGVIGVVLTGMGSDGTAGARLIVDAGGRVVAEAESTCVVYGMPRSVVDAGAAHAVVPLPEIAATVTTWVQECR